MYIPYRNDNGFGIDIFNSYAKKQTQKYVYKNQLYLKKKDKKYYYEFSNQSTNHTIIF